MIEALVALYRMEHQMVSPAGIDRITPPRSADTDNGKPTQPKSAHYIEDFNKHEAHPDCPDTLACLPDTEGRPQHTLPVILRCAILGSPRRRLTIREIYAAMEDKYAYYKTAGPTWKVRDEPASLTRMHADRSISNPSGIIFH